jgi:DNA-binding phage protein
MARDATVRTVLTANDQASGPIKAFQNTLKGVKGEMSDLNDTTALLTGGLAGIAAAVGVQALQQLGAAVADLGRQGEQMGMLRTSFDQLAGSVGQSSAQMLDAMRTASGGMIADQELILSSNRAMMLGVADSSAEMAQLLEVAAVRGRAMGLSTAQAFNDLVTGLGRMSPLILDNLGIVTGGEKVFIDYAKSIGKSAEALTDAEKKQALFNKVINETDTSAAPLVSQFERMDAAIQNAKMALGELFSPAIAAIAQDLANAVNEVTDAMRTDAIEAAQNNLWDFGNEVLRLAQQLQDLQALSSFAQLGGDTAQLAKIEEDLANTTTQLQVYVENYNQAAALTGAPLIDPAAIEQGTIAYMDAAAAAAYLARQQEVTADSGQMLAEAERMVASASGMMQGALNRAGSAVDTIRNKFVQAAAAGMNASLAFNEFSKFKGLQDQAAQIQSGLGNLGFYDSEEIAFYVDLNTETAITSADDMIDKFEEMNKAASKAGGGVSELDQALSGLQGKALSAVQQATQLDVGINPEDFLPREDAVNENARRLAAIMRDGFADQPWLEKFKNEVPGVFAELAASADPRGTAAQMLQEFQAGLRPELLDLGAIKEKIKTDLAGEAAMKATAAQITAELVADTGGDSADIQAKVAKALGLGVAQADVTGGILGELNSATFTAQLASAATGAGKGWGSTFLSMVGSNVPTELIGILTNLVTPEVLARIQQAQSQTEPPT